MDLLICQLWFCTESPSKPLHQEILAVLIIIINITIVILKSKQLQHCTAPPLRATEKRELQQMWKDKAVFFALDSCGDQVKNIFSNLASSQTTAGQMVLENKATVCFLGEPWAHCNLGVRSAAAENCLGGLTYDPAPRMYWLAPDYWCITDPTSPDVLPSPMYYRPDQDQDHRFIISNQTSVGYRALCWVESSSHIKCFSSVSYHLARSANNLQ